MPSETTTDTPAGINPSTQSDPTGSNLPSPPLSQSTTTTDSDSDSAASHSDSDSDSASDAEDEKTVNEQLRPALALACSGEAKLIEVVGLETIRRDWTEAEVEVEIEAIRRSLKKFLEGKGWDEARASERAAEIVFISGDDFIKRKGDKAMEQSKAANRRAILDDLCELGEDDDEFHDAVTWG